MVTSHNSTNHRIKEACHKRLRVLNCRELCRSTVLTRHLQTNRSVTRIVLEVIMIVTEDTGLLKFGKLEQ